MKQEGEKKDRLEERMQTMETEKDYQHCKLRDYTFSQHQYAWLYGLLLGVPSSLEGTEKKMYR